MSRPVWSALLLAALACPALAQDTLSGDPTRPPAVLSAPAPGSAMPAPEQDLQLQSILVSKRAGGRRLAVIEGKTVREGERVGGAVIETIRPTEVVIRRGKLRKTLKLFRPA
ncbi:MAG TPA: MSHA biogenesis protein MshK [Telluria sp.]